MFPHLAHRSRLTVLHPTYSQSGASLFEKLVSAVYLAVNDKGLHVDCEKKPGQADFCIKTYFLCEGCGTQAERHHALGRCKLCYDLRWQAEHPDALRRHRERAWAKRKAEKKAKKALDSVRQ